MSGLGQSKIKYQSIILNSIFLRQNYSLSKNPGVTLCYKKCNTQKFNKKNLKKIQNAKRSRLLIFDL